MAEQPTAIQMQQMQRQPRGLMGFLRDPRVRQTLASMDRSGLFQGVAQQAGKDIARQEEIETQNRTAQWLASQPNGQKYADAILAGMPASSIYSQYVSDQQATTGIKVGDRLIDPKTGDIIYQDDQAISQLDKDQVGVVAQLNGQLRQIYRPYDEIFNGYNLIKNAISRRQEGNISSGIDDLTVTIAFAKILDPESVVRSEESAAVSRAGGGINAAINAFKNFLTGEGLLADDVRQRIFRVASDTAKTWFEKSTKEYDRVLRTAKLYGIPDDIAQQVFSKPQQITITPIPPSNDEDQTNNIIPQSAIDAGLTQEDWNRMDETERAPFL